MISYSLRMMQSLLLWAVPLFFLYVSAAHAQSTLPPANASTTTTATAVPSASPVTQVNPQAVPQAVPQATAQTSQVVTRMVYQAPKEREIRTTGIRGLWVAGAIVWPVSWALTWTITLSITEDPFEQSRTYLSFIPLVGPYLMMADDATEDYFLPLLASGLLQTAGLAMIIAGVAIRREVVVRGFALNPSDPHSERLSFGAHPIEGGAMAHLTLTHF